MEGEREGRERGTKGEKEGKTNGGSEGGYYKGRECVIRGRERERRKEVWRVK